MSKQLQKKVSIEQPSRRLSIKLTYHTIKKKNQTWQMNGCREQSLVGLKLLTVEIHASKARATPSVTTHRLIHTITASPGMGNALGCRAQNGDRCCKCATTACIPPVVKLSDNGRRCNWRYFPMCKEDERHCMHATYHENPVRPQAVPSYNW